MFTARVGALDYRASLKAVAKKEYMLEKEKAEAEKDKPDWASRARSVTASEPVSGAASEYEDDD